MPANLKGVYPVYQTPYYEDESVDYDTFEQEIEWLFEAGVDGVVQAMVSEILRLTSEERKELAEMAVRCASGRGNVVISVGAESARLAEDYARHAESVAADAVMAVPPIHVAAGEPELLRYYERILAATKLPVIIQDASGYVGKPLSMEFYDRLHQKHGDRLYYKPEATPIGPRLSALRDLTGRRARIFEGSGGSSLVDAYRRGIVGVMPGAEAVHAVVRLWRALQKGDEERIYRIALPLSALVHLQQGLDGFLAIEKYLLVKQGVFRNTIVRGPVGFQLDEETRQEVDRLFAQLQDAVKS